MTMTVSWPMALPEHDGAPWGRRREQGRGLPARHNIAIDKTPAARFLIPSPFGTVTGRLWCVCLVLIVPSWPPTTPLAIAGRVTGKRINLCTQLGNRRRWNWVSGGVSGTIGALLVDMVLSC